MTTNESERRWSEDARRAYLQGFEAGAAAERMATQRRANEGDIRIKDCTADGVPIPDTPEPEPAPRVDPGVRVEVTEGMADGAPWKRAEIVVGKDRYFGAGWYGPGRTGFDSSVAKLRAALGLDRPEAASDTGLPDRIKQAEAETDRGENVADKDMRAQKGEDALEAKLVGVVRDLDFGWDYTRASLADYVVEVLVRYQGEIRSGVKGQMRDAIAQAVAEERAAVVAEGRREVARRRKVGDRHVANCIEDYVNRIERGGHQEAE